MTHFKAVVYYDGPARPTNEQELAIEAQLGNLTGLTVTQVNVRSAYQRVEGE
jgi:hypothetical protein